MKAMIFAAGLGTRLRPLTNDKPKALVPYKGKPLLQIVIEKIAEQGFNDIVVNVHHFADKVIDFLEQNNNFGQNIIISDERNQLLETGGGLQKAAPYFNEPFLVHNVDILADIDLKRMYKEHLNNDSLATLAVQNRESGKRLYFNKKNNFLCKWKNEQTGEEKIARTCIDSMPYAFSGIHIISPKIFEFMQPGAYSVIDTYLFAGKTEKISFFDHSDLFWRDMGKPESFEN